MQPGARNEAVQAAPMSAGGNTTRMNEPLVSVVTPFYNTAPYLAECIASVLAQRYANFEYVLLDNMSSDGSHGIAAEFAAGDSRIRLLRNDQLLPQVPNYNRAIAHCSLQARYIKVVEADNWLYPECLAQMVERAVANPTVGVVSSYNTTETRVRMTGLPLDTKVMNGRALFEATFDRQQYLFGAPTTVLMRADLVRARSPFYDESLATAEDLSACWDLLADSDFGFVHQVLCFVRSENESILSRIRGFEAQELDRYLVARRHAGQFVPPEQLLLFLAAAERRYYRAVARAALLAPRPGLLAFHRERVSLEGFVFDEARLRWALLREAAGMAVHPAQLREALAAGRLRRLARGAAGE